MLAGLGFWRIRSASAARGAALVAGLFPVVIALAARGTVVPTLLVATVAYVKAVTDRNALAAGVALGFACLLRHEAVALATLALLWPGSPARAPAHKFQYRTVVVALVVFVAGCVTFGRPGALVSLVNRLTTLGPLTENDLNLFAVLGGNQVQFTAVPGGGGTVWLATVLATVCLAIAVRRRWQYEADVEVRSLIVAAMVLTGCALFFPGNGRLAAAPALAFAGPLVRRQPATLTAFLVLGLALWGEAAYVEYGLATVQLQASWGYRELLGTSAFMTATFAMKVAATALLLFTLGRGHSATSPAASWADAYDQWVAAIPFALRRTDVACLSAATLACLGLNLADLGVRVYPSKGTSMNQIFQVKTADTTVTDLWIMKSHHDSRLTVRCGSVAPGKSIELDYMAAYQWIFLKLPEPCAGDIELGFAGDGVVYEILMASADGAFVHAGEVCQGGCIPFAASPLFDETSNWTQPPTRSANAAFDEYFNIVTEIQRQRFPDEDRIGTAHPFLGRAIIALSMRVFGVNPWGWRFPNAVIGALLPLLVFLLARAAVADRKVAYLAMILALLAPDRLGLARLGIVEMQTATWLVIGYVACFHGLRCRRSASRSVVVAFFGGASLAFAAAAATKWNGLFAWLVLAPVGALAVRQEAAAVGTTAWSFIATRAAAIAAAAIAALVAGIGVYVLAYLPFAGERFSLATVLRHQATIWRIHTKEHLYIPYQSSAYTWPWIDQPLVLHAVDGLDDTVAEVTALVGNPTVYWLIVPSVLAIFCLPAWRRSFGAPLIVAAAAAQIVPWFVIGRGSFFYHFFTAAPYSYVAVAWTVTRVGEGRRWLVLAYVAGVALAFGIFLPLVMGWTVPSGYFAGMRWFDNWFRSYAAGAAAWF